MSAFKGTPGEWRQYAGDPLIIVNAEGSSLGEMVPGDPYIGHEEALANARAVAAVPQLIVALERVEPQIGWRSMAGENPDHYYCEFCAGSHSDAPKIEHHDECLVIKVRQALAAATGGKGED